MLMMIMIMIMIMKINYYIQKNEKCLKIFVKKA